MRYKLACTCADSRGMAAERTYPSDVAAEKCAFRTPHLAPMSDAAK